MPILKSSPGQLAIHGGGPPAFESKLPAFSANVGEGCRFAALAESMFNGSSPTGGLVEEFETALADWLVVRNVVGFASLPAATRALSATLGAGRVFAPTLGTEVFGTLRNATFLECEATTYGMSPRGLSRQKLDAAEAVFAINPLGNPCDISKLLEICDESDLPLFLYGHQAIGCCFDGEKLGGFGHAEIFDFGRDQLIHAMDSAVVTTNDDLLAFRLRNIRSSHLDGIAQGMGDAAAAMGIANLEAAEGFAAANRIRYELYGSQLHGIPGIKLTGQSAESTCQSIAVEVDPGLAGITRNSLRDILTAEHVGTSIPFVDHSRAAAPVASRLAASLLQLPSGPAATGEAIEAVCRLIELAIVHSLESPDPLQIAA